MESTSRHDGGLLDVLQALASEPRMRVIALLAQEDLHVSELARRIGMSRPLLYQHLTRLEQAGLISGELSVTAEGRALKTYSLVPFSLHLDPATIAATVAGTTPRSSDA